MGEGRHTNVVNFLPSSSQSHLMAFYVFFPLFASWVWDGSENWNSRRRESAGKRNCWTNCWKRNYSASANIQKNYNHQTIVLFNFNLRDVGAKSSPLFGVAKPLWKLPRSWMKRISSNEPCQRLLVYRFVSRFVGACAEFRRDERSANGMSTAKRENAIFHGA